MSPNPCHPNSPNFGDTIARTIVVPSIALYFDTWANPHPVLGNARDYCGYVKYINVLSTPYLKAILQEGLTLYESD